MESTEISRQFAEFAGKDKFGKFIEALCTTCRERQRLLYWQEQIWNDFQKSRHLKTGNTFPEISRIFDAEIQKKDEEIQKRIQEARSRHPVQHALLKLLPFWEAIGTGAVAGGVAGLAAYYFAGSKLTFPIFIVVYILHLSRLKGTDRIIGTVSFVATASLIVALMELLSHAYSVLN